jgi:hypothetical protein
MFAGGGLGGGEGIDIFDPPIQITRRQLRDLPLGQRLDLEGVLGQREGSGREGEGSGCGEKQVFHGSSVGLGLQALPSPR